MVYQETWTLNKRVVCYKGNIPATDQPIESLERAEEEYNLARTKGAPGEKDEEGTELWQSRLNLWGPWRPGEQPGHQKVREHRGHTSAPHNL